MGKLLTAFLALTWLVPISGREARAQSAALYISAVDLEITPGAMSKFLAALQPDGAAMIREPGAREFDAAVGEKDANHVFIFEVYGDAAAYAAHQKTSAYGKFVGATMMMIKTYTIRPFSSVAMNLNAAAQAPSGPLFINQVELDIVPAQFGPFIDAAKLDGAASMQEPGCREFNIAISQKNPHHLMLFEVYSDAAALAVHEATDHFKTYEAATKDMVEKRQVNQLSSVAMLKKDM